MGSVLLGLWRSFAQPSFKNEFQPRHRRPEAGRCTSAYRDHAVLEEEERVLGAFYLE